MKNEPAFPHEFRYSDGEVDRTDGMTIRQWYKGQALKSELCPFNAYDFKEIADWCGKIADAMLQEDADFSARTEVKNG